MRIVHISSELSPIAKVGGLGDVVYGLSQEFVRLGHSVEIILPKYDVIDYLRLSNLHVASRELWCEEGGARYNNTFWKAEMGKLSLLFLESHHPSYYFSRGSIYGCHDDIDRFTYLCKAALVYLFKEGNPPPDVIHVHDWPTASCAFLYKELYSLPKPSPKIVLTIHNLHHQGKCSPDHLARLGLSRKLLEKLQDPYAPDHINLLKGGIEYADAVTTVSPNYMQEILTPEGGCGLHTTLLKRKNSLYGILNGIDEHFWNPEKDPHLIAHYPTQGITTLQQLEATLKGKKENKKHIRAHFGLSDSKSPLVACVTRLVPQKGPELIQHALLRVLEKGGQFVLLGSAHPSPTRDLFEKLKTSLSAHKHLAISLDNDEALAHLIFAAADIFVIPSLFEPCGLTQMIALRYGTVPVARMTGGLVDTVFDIDTSKLPQEKRNGFTFDFPDHAGINWALDRALEYWIKTPEKWKQLMLQGMAYDFSWKHAAPEYLKIYTENVEQNKKQLLQ